MINTNTVGYYVESSDIMNEILKEYLCTRLIKVSVASLVIAITVLVTINANIAKELKLIPLILVQAAGLLALAYVVKTFKRQISIYDKFNNDINWKVIHLESFNINTDLSNTIDIKVIHNLVPISEQKRFNNKSVDIHYLTFENRCIIQGIILDSRGQDEQTANV